MSAEALSKINHDPTKCGFFDGVERLLQRNQAAPCPRCHATIGPGIPKKRVDLYAAQASAQQARFISNYTYVSGIDA